MSEETKIRYSCTHKLEADTELLEAIGFKSGDIGAYTLSHEVSIPKASVELIRKGMGNPLILKALIAFAEKVVKNMSPYDFTMPTMPPTPPEPPAV